MLSRPTTEQIILDCRTQLLELIAPAVDAEPIQIAIQMMENVLRNVAARAAHEIAWMREEGDDAVSFAQGVAASATGNSSVTDALTAYESGRSDSLHLDDVVVTYDLAGRCLTAAVEAAMAAGDDDAHRAGRALLDQRIAHENEIMGEWTMVGRA
jgi:hypothetical protein